MARTQEIVTSSEETGIAHRYYFFIRRGSCGKQNFRQCRLATPTAHAIADLLFPHLPATQAIAILGTSFINFGDHELFITMWANVIRISQFIGLDKRYAPIELEDAGLSHKTRQRLWWTLVVCEWFVSTYIYISIASDVLGIAIGS
jgi:hypothetical protein